MEFSAVILTVKDIESSKRFYCDILGLKVLGEYTDNVRLECNICLQKEEFRQKLIRKHSSDIIRASHVVSLYFETKDIDIFVDKLKTYSELEYIHPLLEQQWHQRIVRFYDPDGNIVEVGESAGVVFNKCLADGMTVQQISEELKVPVGFIKSILD